MENFIVNDFEYKYKAVGGINKGTEVYLDSAKNFEEAKYQMSLLEKHTSWCLITYKQKKEA